MRPTLDEAWTSGAYPRTVEPFDSRDRRAARRYNSSETDAVIMVRRARRSATSDRRPASFEPHVKAMKNQRTLASISTVCFGGLLAVIATTACRSSDVGREPNGARRPQVLQPTPLEPQDPLETIARYEDARSDGDGLLQSLLQRGEPRTRERAAFALGRLGVEEHGASVTAGLVAALDDESNTVRAAAAFALGQRADPASTTALLAHSRDADPIVRARIIEAASRIDDARLRSLCLAALDDVDPRVQSEAVLAPSRFKAGLPDADVVDSVLVDFVSRARATAAKQADSGAKRATDETKRSTEDAKRTIDDDARWRGLFTLARRKSERARAVFITRSASPEVRERIFAVQGLGALSADEPTRVALCTALSDPDARVACEAALALGKHPDAQSLPALARAAGHSSAHVRRMAFEALGAFRDQRESLRALIEHARGDAASNVRAAALGAAGKLFGDECAPQLELALLEKDAQVRAGAAAAAAHLSSSIAVPLLDRISRDPNLRVAGIAIEGFAKHATDDSKKRLRELMHSSDNGLRLAAVTSLTAMISEADVPALRDCFRSTSGDIASEVATSILDAAAKLGGDPARELLKQGAEHADPFVRKKARTLFVQTFPNEKPPRDIVSEARLAAVPIPGKDMPVWKQNPRVEVATSRGTLVFELFPDEAPAHVFNFLALAEKHHYDGLTFHRVVPDFVIQGGDTRGDGNGAVTWRGEPLRAEFGPRKYVRGSLGMPRNDDPDSGGSQFFVTHRETPNLDGRYTIFGELREGFDALDAIEVGDTIVSVRLLNPR